LRRASAGQKKAVKLNAQRNMKNMTRTTAPNACKPYGPTRNLEISDCAIVQFPIDASKQSFGVRTIAAVWRLLSRTRPVNGAPRPKVSRAPTNRARYLEPSALPVHPWSKPRGSSATDQAARRLSAEDLPVRRSATRSKETFCPSLREPKPARSTALM